MALNTTLKLKFDGAAVKKGLSNVVGQFRNIGAAAMNFAKLGAGLAIGAVGVIAALTAVVMKINKIGEEANTVDNRLANVTKQMGLFGSESKEVSDRLSDLADTQARMLGIDDDIISNTEAKLMTFKELAASADTVGGAFDRATMAAIDMAAAGFGEAEQNAVQLGKALNDPIKGINSLTRSGITFTTAEKDKIKVLVASNQMHKAQDMVLKAIETQVGNTALATANGSAKIKVSLSQLLEEFAKPFSEGFNEIPGAMEGVFPKLKEIAGTAGRVVSGGISDAIAGDYTKFIAIGDIIGTVIGIGMKAAYLAATSSMVKGSVDYLSGVSESWGFGKSIASQKLPDAPTFSELVEAGAINSNLQSKLDALRSGTQGLVPGTQGGFEYAQPGERSMFSDANGNKVIQLLTRIDRNLAPQP